MNEVREYFNNYGIREWDRLNKDFYGRINFQLHMDFIKEYIYPGITVLDAGCGAGRFSIELAKSGCEVTLFDISEEQLKIAKVKAIEYDLNHKMKDYIQGDIRDLSMFSDNSFDLVLCYGAPLSYLMEDRDIALRELTRVTKKNGTLVASVNNKWGILKMGLGNNIPDFFNNREYWYIDKVIETGDLPKHLKVNHPARHFFEASELLELMENSGLKNVSMGGSPLESLYGTFLIIWLLRNAIGLAPGIRMENM